MTDNVLMLSIIYILIIALLIVLIILGIKAIFAVDTLNDNLKEVNKKLHSFDGMFDFFEGVSYSLSVVNKKFISKIDYVLGLLPGKKRKGDK